MPKLQQPSNFLKSVGHYVVVRASAPTLLEQRIKKNYSKHFSSVCNKSSKRPSHNEFMYGLDEDVQRYLEANAGS